MKGFIKFLKDFFTKKEPLPLYENTYITKAGLNAAAYYYALKYPERGDIFPIYSQEVISEEAAKKTADIIREKFGNNPTKITITTVEQHPWHPYHSHPFLLIGDKLISLRGDDDWNRELHSIFANALGVPLIKPKKHHTNFKEMEHHAILSL